jgi:hypothetical protein
MIKKAMELSMQQTSQTEEIDEEEEMVRRAMAMSIKEEEDRKAIEY